MSSYILQDCNLQEIIDKIREEPKQLHFNEDLFPPCYTIKEEYLTSCNVAFSWIDSNGAGPYGSISSVDHPAFAALRNHLANEGYIKMETCRVNGDYVIKPFYLNNVDFKVGDTFVCASAMRMRLRRRHYC